MEKKILFTAFYLIMSLFSYSQNYIKIIGRDIELCNEIVIDSSDISYSNINEGVSFKNTQLKVTVSKSKVDYVETKDGRLIFFNIPDTCKFVIHTSHNSSFNDVIKKGNNVYVPLPKEQKDITNRLGNSLLRDYLMKIKFWNVVENESEAHFILEYLFSEVGRDNAKLIIKNRSGKIIFNSPTVSAIDDDPRNAARISINELCRKHINLKR